jgi:hypothetical protein
MSENEGLFAFHIQKVNTSVNSGRIPLYLKGDRKPYHRTVDFPVEIREDLLSPKTTFSFCDSTEVGPFTKKLVKLAQQVYARQGNPMSKTLGGITITGQPVAGKNATINQSGTYAIGGTVYSGGWPANYIMTAPSTLVPKFKVGQKVQVQDSHGTSSVMTITCYYYINNSIRYDGTTDNGSWFVSVEECNMSSSPIFEQPFDYEITNDLAPQVCTCKTLDLMAYGCKCGSFKRELAARKTDGV